MGPPYAMDGERIVWTASTRPVRYEATEIRKERGLVHATVRVVETSGGAEKTAMRGTLNVNDPKDIIWFANRAHEGLNGTAAQYTKDAMKKDLDWYVEGLWNYQLERYRAVELSGDPNPSPPSFILNPYILESGGTILFAPPGRGKSYTAYVMAISIDAGITTFFPLQRRKVLMVNLERSEQSLRSRYGRINTTLGLPADRALLTLNARGKALVDVVPLIEREIKERGVLVVILDSISRAGMGSLVEDQPANRIIDALNGLGVTWLAIGHTPRNDESHLFGSMHFEAGADVVVQLLTETSVGDPSRMGVGLQITKQNDIGPQPLRIFQMTFNEMGLTGFRPAKEVEYPKIARGEQADLQERITQFLLGQRLGEATIAEIVDGTGSERSTISAKLNELKGRVFVERPGRGNKGAKTWRVLMPGQDRATQRPLVPEQEPLDELPDPPEDTDDLAEAF